MTPRPPHFADHLSVAPGIRLSRHTHTHTYRDQRSLSCFQLPAFLLLLQLLWSLQWALHASVLVFPICVMTRVQTLFISSALIWRRIWFAESNSGAFFCQMLRGFRPHFIIREMPVETPIVRLLPPASLCLHTFLACAQLPCSRSHSTRHVGDILVCSVENVRCSILTA